MPSERSKIITTHRFGILLVDGGFMTMQGDPDRGNEQRTDYDGHGIVSAAMPKRKIRDQLAMDGHEIYVARGACLSRTRDAVAASIDVDLSGISSEDEGEDDDEGDAIVEEAPKAKKGSAKSEKKPAAQKPGKRGPVSPADAERLYQEVARRFIDARFFGQAMPGLPGTLRGPIQFSWGITVDPVIVTRACITRVAVETEKEEKKQNGANRGMGSGSFVPYGLYRFHFYVNPSDARHTGFTEADYDLFLAKLSRMFEFDRSSARPTSCVRGLFDFTLKEKPTGIIHQEQMLEAIQVRRREPSRPARSFSDYEVIVPKKVLSRDGQDFVFRKVVDVVNPWVDADAAAE